jgi:hypothetical protein
MVQGQEAFRDKKASNEKQEFNSLLVRAVDTALVECIGDSATKAVKVCIEVSVITKDPDQFKAQLEKLFSGSETGSKLLEDKIMRTLAGLLNQSHAVSLSVDDLKEDDLRQFIEDCKTQLQIS